MGKASGLRSDKGGRTTAPRSAKNALNPGAYDAVGAERIELSTNGLRVLCRGTQEPNVARKGRKAPHVAQRRPAKRGPRPNPMALALAKAFFQVERRRKLFVATLVAQGFTEARAIELWSRVEDRGRA